MSRAMPASTLCLPYPALTPRARCACRPSYRHLNCMQRKDRKPELQVWIAEVSVLSWKPRGAHMNGLLTLVPLEGSTP